MNGLAQKLLSWYSKNKIDYPWRKSTDPYKVWVSEILLQQTRIPVVINYYQKILHRYPDLSSLASANDSDFLALWSGLGYYRRAQNMLECARLIQKLHRGRFPSGSNVLTALPGIGSYTAGALQNICFGELTPAIDGNIRRVLSRLNASNEDLPALFMKIGRSTMPGDFFQSLMELGENVCLPNPLCERCPIRSHCKAYKAGAQLKFPMVREKKKFETFHWYLLVLRTGASHYYIQNTTRAFLKSAWIFPDLLTPTILTPPQQIRRFQVEWGIRVSGIQEASVVQHSVTFRKIVAHILIPKNFELNGSGGKWLNAADFYDHPTSSITAKVLRSLQIQNRQTKPAQQTLK